MKKLLLVTCTFVCATMIFAQSSYQLLTPASFVVKAQQKGAVTKVNTFLLSTQALDQLCQQAPLTLKLQFTLPGEGNIEVALEKKNIFDPSFVVNSATGKKENIDLGVHYTGKVNGDERSMVAFSFFHHCFFGLVANDRGNYTIGSIKDEVTKNVTDQYVIYNDRDLTIPNTFTCKTDELPQNDHAVANNDARSERIVTNCKTVKQYYECDYKMYQDNGHSIANTVAFTTGMFNVIKGIYDNEDIRLSVSEIFVWDVDDNYPVSNSTDALNAFADHTQDAFNGDLAHILSTVSSGNGGLAWLSVLCVDYYAPWHYGPYAYSNIDDDYEELPLWSWTINCSAHETGHNLGSPHTQWCGWEVSPGVFTAIDSCYATELDPDGHQCYTGPVVPRIGTIMSYCHLGLGTNLNLGFGPLPSARMREEIYGAECVTAPGITDPLLSQTGNTVHCNPDSTSIYTYEWYDENDVLVSSGSASYNPPAEGNYKLIMTNASGCYSQAIIYFIPNTAGINNEEGAWIYTLWPNPATDLVQLKWAGNHIPSGDVKIELLDMSGRAVLSKIFPSSGGSAFMLDVSSVRTGLYVLEINSGDLKAQSKLMIAK